MTIYGKKMDHRCTVERCTDDPSYTNNETIYIVGGSRVWSAV